MKAVLRQLRRILAAALLLAAANAPAEVAPGTAYLPPERVRQEVVAFVGRTDPYPGHKTVVDFVGEVRPIPTAPGAQVAVSTSKTTSWAGRTSFLVETRGAGGRVIAQSWVATRVRVRATGYRAVAGAERGHEFGEADLAPVEVDLGTAPSDVLLDRGEILGRRARQAIPAGTILARRLVETPPLVKRGDVVTIVLNRAGMVLRTSGQVAQDAVLDQRVKVLNLETKRAVFARVVDRNTVRVDF